MTKYPKEGWYGPNVLQVILLPVVVAVLLFLFGCATPQPPTVPVYTLEPVKPKIVTPQPTAVALSCPGATVVDAHRVCLVEVVIDAPEFWMDGSPTGFVYQPDSEAGEPTELLAIDLTASVGNHCMIWRAENRYVNCEAVRARE